MSQKIWVQHKTASKTYGPTKITIDGLNDVDDLIKEIRKETQLNIPQNTLITVYQADGKTEFDVGDSPFKQLEGNSGLNPLTVQTASVLASSRQVTTRRMSVDASCRKYLDAIAKRLAEFYDFSYRFTSGATIGDVLEAKDGVEGEDWDIRKARKTRHQVDVDGDVVLINKGQPLSETKLPDIYTAEEWGRISKLNEKISARVHNGTLCSTSNGKAYIIIPHSEFTEEMIQFLKSIGVKASLFSSPDDLEVKDEDCLSDSSFMVC
ncbi:hypothetical protein MP228_006479 [Amoeboaphelidium protococcarum]|nr:hypothetical protein MP228_006479 [Amoeboaphelidium protococcarum]